MVDVPHTTKSRPNLPRSGLHKNLVRKLSIEKTIAKLQLICNDIYGFIRKQADNEIRNQMKNTFALQSIVTKDFTV